MSQIWFARIVSYDEKKKVTRYVTKTDRPVDDFASYFWQFHQGARRIEWTPVESNRPDAKELGCKRAVDFDATGKVLRREPDAEEMHRGSAEADPQIEPPAAPVAAAPATVEPPPAAPVAAAPEATQQ